LRFFLVTDRETSGWLAHPSIGATGPATQAKRRIRALVPSGGDESLEGLPVPLEEAQRRKPADRLGKNAVGGTKISLATVPMIVL